MESAERSSKVARLAEHLYTMKSSKKGLSKGQIDEIVKLIKSVDDDGRHVDALDLPPSARTGSQRWKDDKMKAMLA